VYWSTKVGLIFFEYLLCKLFIWTGVKVGKDIIEGKIHGHNIPKMLNNNKAFNFSYNKLLHVFVCLGFLCFMSDLWSCVKRRWFSNLSSRSNYWLSYLG